MTDDVFTDDDLANAQDRMRQSGAGREGPDLYAALRPFLQRDGTYVIPNTTAAVASIGLALGAGSTDEVRRLHPGEPHEFRTTCQTCGERGFLHVAVITDNETVTIEARAALTDKPSPEEPHG